MTLPDDAILMNQITVTQYMRPDGSLGIMTSMDDIATPISQYVGMLTLAIHYMIAEP